jgi:hypothetical protein
LAYVRSSAFPGSLLLNIYRRADPTQHEADVGTV